MSDIQRSKEFFFVPDGYGIYFTLFFSFGCPVVVDGSLTMKVAKQRHVGPPRTTLEEARQIVANIPVLRTLLIPKRPKSAEERAQHKEEHKEREDKAISEGLMFAARFSEFEVKYRLRSPRGRTQEEGDQDSQASVSRSDAGDLNSSAGSSEVIKNGGSGLQGAGGPSPATTQLDAATFEGKAGGGTALAGAHLSAANAATLSKKQRFAMSLATLSARAEKRKSLVSEGAIQALSDLAGHNDPTIQKSCASAFSQLSKEQKIRRKMHDEGVVGTLLTLSSTSNSKLVKLDCVRAICNLYCESGYETKALRDSVPAMLIRCVQECPETYEVVLTCILNMSCTSDKIPRIEELNDVLLQLYNLPDILSEKQMLIVLQTLCNLSSMRGNQLKLVEDGCLKIVEKSVRSEKEELRCISTDIVRNLTTDKRTRPKLLDHNIISVLVNMSKDPVDSVKRGAVRAFFNLSNDPTCREKIVSGNAVSVIIKMSQEKMSSVDMGRLAARTLRVLCGDKQVAYRLVSDGIVKALMALLRTDDGAIQQYCAESICSLFQLKDVLGPLIQQGAVSVIVSLSQNSTDPITGEWCSFALYHLATNKACPDQTLAHGVLPCLIKLCDVSSPRTKYFCAAAFAYITLLPAQGADIDPSGAIPILVHMLREESDVNTKNNCAASLYNLADDDHNCFLMMEAGALLPVVHLTQSDNLQTKIKCAAILCRLSLQKQYYSQFAGEDVLQMLLALSNVDHTLTQRRVIISLSNLSQNQDLRRQLLHLDPFPYIIALASKRDENLRRGCVSIVCNLAYESGNERAIVYAKVVPTLLITAMISSDQIETKQICVKAMVNLMADSSLYKNMVDDGAIWGFSSLAQLGDPVLVELCAKAICSLSCEFAEQMLLSTSTLKTILMLVNRDDDVELQRLGGRALLNLLVCTTNEHAPLHALVVQNLTRLAACKDEEISELTILSLCIISMSESCRERIVNSGMLNMIDASTIFASAPLCYAYLTMFGNIANNPTMRTKILDDKSVSRFEQICKAGDSSLDLAVIKAIYCISCAQVNIPKLADQNLLPVISNIHRAKYEKTPEMLLYIIVTLYNMTTVPEVHAKLVVQGYVSMLTALWPEAKRDPKMGIQLIMAILHMANGHINSTRLVDDGAVPILVFLAEKKHPTGFIIPYTMYHRCAAAMRNLLCASSNQVKMVKAGAIEALINLAQRAENPRHISDPLSPSIKENCAAALRSMTYNEAIRDTLKNSEAIDIMLEEDDKLQYSLLVELEAESWTNGARGTSRQGRAKTICPGPLVTDLLKPTVDVKLQIDKRYAELSKFNVLVQLDEPNLEIEASVNDLSIGINDLASYEDTEDATGNGGGTIQLCPKQEMELSAVPIHLLKASEEAEESLLGGEGMVSATNTHEQRPEESGRGAGFPDRSSRGSFDGQPQIQGGDMAGSFSMAGGKFDSLPSLKPASATGPFIPPASAGIPPPSAAGARLSSGGIHIGLSKSLNASDFPALFFHRKDGPGQNSLSASLGQLPPVQPGSGGHGGNLAGPQTTPGSPGDASKSPDNCAVPGSKKRPKAKKPIDPEKNFGTLVAMIKSGANIDAVVNRWTAISRF